jgi:hypothetical protein
METMHETVQSLPEIACEEGLCLFEHLTRLALTGTCFCCGFPTDLLLKESGEVLVLCPKCGAEISGEDIPREAPLLPVLQAA